MPVTLQKWGHSVGVRLPKPMLEQIGLSEGAQVDVLVEGDHLVIRRARRRPTLDELLDQCKPENRPETIDWGPAGRPRNHLMALPATCRIAVISFAYGVGSACRAGTGRRAPGSGADAAALQ